MAEKRELIQTLEISKISAQTEEDSRLKKDEEISVLPVQSPDICINNVCPFSSLFLHDTNSVSL